MVLCAFMEKEGIIMDNHKQQIYNAPAGALLIVLVSIISFVNAVVSYIFDLQYVNYGVLGLGATFLHVAQALALLGLGVHFYNKSTGKLAVLFNALISAASIAFILFLKSSDSVYAIEMMEYDYWLDIGKVFSFGTGTSILYIILILSFVLNVFLIKRKKEGDSLTDVRILTVVQVVSSCWSHFSEDVLGIQFVHIATYILLALGLYMCAVNSTKGKFVIASHPISKKSVRVIVLVMIIVSLIMVPVSFALNDTSPKPIPTIEKECESCEEVFTDSTNKKYISKTNMCRDCYINFCAFTGKEPTNYD